MAGTWTYLSLAPSIVKMTSQNDSPKASASHNLIVPVAYPFGRNLRIAVAYMHRGYRLARFKASQQWRDTVAYPS